MKTWLLILLLSTSAGAQDAPLEVFRVPGFASGVVSRYSPILIPDNAVQEARNVYFDEFGVTRRKGYSQFNSAALTDTKSVRGLWPFTADDGTRYLVALSSQTLYKAPTTGVFSAISASTFSAIADMDAVAYLGKIWFANGVDAMTNWNGASGATSTATISEAPLGSMIEGWRNRIVTAGIAGSLSYVYMSKELDGTEWTTGPTTSVDPVAIAFGGTNAKPIKCVYAGFKDFLMVANEDEIYGVYGFGRNDFVVRTISREVGCIEDKSVQEKDGALYWMSRSGIEKMTTQGGIQRISDGVKDVFDELIGNTAVNRTKLYTTQAHWEAGNLQASGPGATMSAVVSPGNLAPSTWTRTDTAGSDFAAGSYTSRISTQGEAGALVLNASSLTAVNFGAESNDNTNFTSNTGWVSISTHSYYGSRSWQASFESGYSGEFGFGIYDEDSVLISSAIYSFGESDIDDVWIEHVFTDLPINHKYLIYEFYTGNGSPVAWHKLRTVPVMPSAEMVVAINGFRTGVQDFHLAFDINETFVSSGTFTSQTFDTTFSTPIGGPFSFTDSVVAGSTIAYSVRSSSTSTLPTWSSWTLVSTTTSGAYRVPLVQRYWQWKADFSATASTYTPAIQDVTLAATTTGQYIHECAQIDTISSWGNFQANSVLDGGSISYFVSTGTTCDSVQRATVTWNAQNNNAPITISTAAFLGIKETFTVASSTNTALLRDVTINWLEGTSRPPVASAVYLNRYYLAYTTSSASSVNDFMFVADKNDAPTFLENMNCYSLGIFNRKMFCGDANATGNIFQMETGENDNGSAFTSYVRTKAYHFGDPDAEKEFVKMYADFAPESDTVLDINITPSYHLDLSTTAITLGDVNTGEDATAGMLVSKIPFAVSNNLTGRFLDVQFTHTGSDGGWTLFGLNFYLRKYDVK